MDEYAKNKIKDYKYWSVYIHPVQDYLGRLVIWCNREGAVDLASITPDEQKELFTILKESKEALAKAFKPDLFNYSFLGNKQRHLHGHLVPRYSSDREFLGATFKDELWGQNYRTNHSFKIPDDILEKIKLEIQKELK